MDLQDTHHTARYLIRDRDTTFGRTFDTVLADSGIQIMKSGVQIPRMNSIIERWIQTCRHELLDRTLIWNQRHLLHALRKFELFYNGHRPHRAPPTPHRCTRCPNRSPSQPRSDTWTSTGETDSTASSTNTNTPPDQAGRLIGTRKVPDRRARRGRRPPLLVVLVLTACATLVVGNDSVTAIQQWAARTSQHVLQRLGARRDPLLDRFMVPSERTFRRVLADLDADALDLATCGYATDVLRGTAIAPVLPRTRAQPNANSGARRRTPTTIRHRPGPL